MRIVVALPVNDRHKALFLAAAPGAELVYCVDGVVSRELAASADVIIGNIAPELVRNTQRLKWLQLSFAGTEGFCDPGALPEHVLLTNATGAYGMAISEHMIGMLFMLQKHLHRYYDQQRECHWERLEPMTVVDGSTTLVIGLGDIGQTFGRKMAALGSTVIGIRKSKAPKPDWLREQYTMDDLADVIGQADIVAMSLPGYEATRHVINGDILRCMKPNGVIINVGRGMSIDTMALCDALNEGRIGGACLDVTEPEPLPPDHPLWRAKNVLITPHASGGFALAPTLDKTVALSAQNLEHFMNGKPLENVIDRSTGYVRRPY